MNTLVSWIDADAVSGMARHMAAEPPEGVTWSPNPDGDTPVTRLVAEDFRLPEHFAQEPFPAPAPAVPPEERDKVRNFLKEIRQKAEHSGLIPRPAPGETPTVPAQDPAPVLNPAPALNPAAAQEPAPATERPPADSPAARQTPATAPFRTTPLPPRPVAAPAPPASPAGEPPPAAALRLPPLPPQAGGAPSGAVPGPPDTAGAPPLFRQAPHFEVPLGPMAVRLRALTDWIRRQIETGEIFILDAQGCPVGDREAVPTIVASAVVLSEAVRHAAGHLPEAPAGALYLDLEHDRRLCVITTPTSHGHFTLGLILPEALAPRSADRLRRALRRTVEADAPAPLRLPPRERW